MSVSTTAGYSFTGGEYLGGTGSTNITEYTQMGGGRGYKRRQNIEA